jgi:flagellar biosynthesis GTPase FlhF
VLKYYDGSLTKAHSTNKVTLPAKDGQPAKSCQISVSDGADDNALKNIQHFDLFVDGLPRVHPLGYLALIESAFDAGIETMALTSTWRPMTGSVAHRAGLGLDVNYLDTTRLNREELRGKKPAKDADDNVSEEEKKLFKEKEEAETEAKKAKADLEKLQAEQAALQKQKKANPNKVDPTREIALEREIQEASAKGDAAKKKKTAADDAWDEERNKNEPGKVRGYRASLSQCKHVKQLYDPWFMDDNTQDKVPAKPNEQKTANEKLHAHHLHITVYEPKIR